MLEALTHFVQGGSSAEMERQVSHKNEYMEKNLHYKNG